MRYNSDHYDFSLLGNTATKPLRKKLVGKNQSQKKNNEFS